ncbi:MAG: DUF4118 domain-containing protein, partial [Anaerolineae bacterium]|nr:DUF4118 domain-containing protein [Anaerolineae bacterium]
MKWNVPHGRAFRYAFAVGLVGIALLLSLVFWPLIMNNPFMFFFAAVALSAWFGGLIPGLLATALAVM